MVKESKSYFYASNICGAKCMFNILLFSIRFREFWFLVCYLFVYMCVCLCVYAQARKYFWKPGDLQMVMHHMMWVTLVL